MSQFWKWLTKTKPNGISPRWLGYMLVPALSLGAAINDYTQWQHAKNWTLKPFKVIESKVFCVMQYRSGKSWHDGETIDCSGADNFIASNEGGWRSVERMHHRIWLGEERIELPLFLPETSLSAEPLGPNDEGNIYVAPEFNFAEPFSDLIARPRAPRDTWMSIGFYGAAILSAVLGEYFHRRRKRLRV